jgi:hypothetical protein
MAYREDGKDWCTYFPDYVPSLVRLKKRVYIGDICKVHDRMYAANKNKFVADWKFFISIAERGLPIFALIAYLGVSTVGWVFYLKAKGN